MDHSIKAGELFLGGCNCAQAVVLAFTDVTGMDTKTAAMVSSSFGGMIAVNLAIMNLLPIPALDGGHLVFTLYEMITGRKPGDKFLEYAQMVGMVILMGLMILAFGNDIFRLFN